DSASCGGVRGPSEVERMNGCFIALFTTMLTKLCWKNGSACSHSACEVALVKSSKREERLKSKPLLLAMLVDLVETSGSVCDRGRVTVVDRSSSWARMLWLTPFEVRP